MPELSTRGSASCSPDTDETLSLQTLLSTFHFYFLPFFFTYLFPYPLHFYLSLVCSFFPLTDPLCRMLPQYYLSLQWGFTSDFILNRIKSRPKLCNNPKWKIMREGSEVCHSPLLKTFLRLWWLKQTLPCLRDEHLQHFCPFCQYFSILLVPSASEGRILKPNWLSGILHILLAGYL